METEVKMRRQFRKVFDLPSGNISVHFPKIITDIYALKLHYKTDSIEELISILQGLCLAEGIRPQWQKITQPELTQEMKTKRMRERALRLCDARARKKAEREAIGASFPDRVKKTREKLGDY